MPVKQAYGPDDVFKLADNGPDGKGGRKQKCHTFPEGLQLMVCGDSRLWYSPWEVPVHLRKDPAKRNVKRESLGSAAKVSYATALSGHLKIRGEIEKGIYPAASSKKGAGRRAKGETFQSYGTPLVAGWAAKRKNIKDVKQMKNVIPKYCSAINDLDIDTVGTNEVIEVLRPIWDEKPAQAEEVRALICRVLKAAGRQELRPNDRGAPASREAIIEVLGKQKKKPGFIRGAMKALTVPEMPEFMTELRATKAQTPRAVEVTILTNVRTNATRWMARSQLLLTPDEIARNKSLYHDGPRWIVPAELMKVDDDNQPFVVPLVPRAIEVIKTQIAYLEELYEGEREVDLLWPGDVNADQPISENTMLDWVKWTMKRKATVHGMRATFQTWAENELLEDEETAKFNPDAIEYCMAHNPGTKVKRAYRRNRLWKPRLGIMNAYSRFLGPVKTRLAIAA